MSHPAPGPSTPILPTSTSALSIPDPFLVDEPDDLAVEGEDPPSPGSQSPQSLAHPSDEISLDVDPTPTQSFLSSAQVEKDVPPIPSSSDPDDRDEEDSPDIIVPGIIAPTMFLPIPHTDPLTSLLTKYIFPPEARPVRDVTGDWRRSDFHSLVMTNNWRALARMARDRIVTSNPDDLHLVLGLWYLRLSSISRLRLFNQTAAECTNLFSVLNAVQPLNAHEYLFDRVLPFELEVMHTRLHYWAGDHMSYLDSLCLLLRKCKSKSRISGKKDDDASVAMWKERGSRISLIIASQLIEMKEFIAAANHLEPLCVQGSTSPAIRSAVGRIYLQAGYMGKASMHFSIVAKDPSAESGMKRMNDVLLLTAQGDWALASSVLRNMLEEDPENHVATNNLAVALLSQGKLKEAIEVLEVALTSSPSAVVSAEPFLFNLSTLYELRSATAAEKKRNLLVEVAKWSGDGLKTTCLKMPAN